ncbi:hypothetical protein BO70DRAFT_341193 [Aspergillus heteromorphus CBS 117.55]|uniref:Heterokaryon incompatibility domain-containing protein n=1 Tax=Aspergillus heteromorphus CBS 117.55 TaxID=1448321 RepID=A0A317VJ03_9EURO|nr:uncharacterized protein BO70DRAFT_341193 [Aspergillus heteromorphus CBS 117.55]PWY74354.1 hypothetical protein BO70DRAFT_341193 [Aspergillus heteromorphus CBS 117.55]
MFKHKLSFPHLPTPTGGSFHEKHAPSDAPAGDVPVQGAPTNDAPAVESPLNRERSAVHKRDFLDDIREATLDSTLVNNARDMRKSALNEVNKITGILTKKDSTNDEKLRGLLHHLVRSRREAFFDNDWIKSSTSDDSDLLLSSFAAQVDDSSFPLRMFDLDTKNMVSINGLGEEDQYCMLSHSWKGAEVDYAYVYDAQRAEHPSGPEDVDDVSRVLFSCEKKIGSIAEKVDKLVETSSNPQQTIRQLLVKSLRASMLEFGLTNAKKNRTTIDAKMRQTEMEQNNYDKLLKFLQVTEEVKSLEQREADAKKEQLDATAKWKQAEKVYILEKPVNNGFRANRLLAYAIDDLIRALQQRRSARKLDQSLRRAREIFQNRPFSKTGKRYIWLDNCCIDKRQNSELTESLARMGEWYANADFCLVHLDTTWDDREWLDEWDLWCQMNGRASNAEENHEDDDSVAKAIGQADPKSKPVMSFENIQEWKPKWSTRGWTLQELVLSKMTFYVNAEWSFLPRPVDVLGSYYYFCPFVDYYTRNLSHVQGWKGDIDATLEEGKVKDALDELAALNAKSDTEEMKAVPESEGKEELNIKRIVQALELFKYVAPRQLDKETARAQISYSVQVAVKALQNDSADEESDGELIVENLWGAVYPDKVKQTIDILLAALALRANGPIRSDRSDIAGFSNVKDLASWCSGTEQNNFSAHSVMKLASHRECTKAIDQAYSLMGILGVQFPAFPAEGLTKALSRLVDEVVIGSNDVSVFNWTGKHNSSPIRGRSLYASNIEAFQSEDEEPKKRPDVNAELVSILRDRRIEHLKVAKGVTNLLLDATKFITTFHQEESVVATLLDMTEFIRNNRLETLKDQLGSPELLAAMKAAHDYALQHTEDQNRRKLEEEQQKKQEKQATEDEKAAEHGRRGSRGLGGLGGIANSLSNLPRVPSFRKESDHHMEKEERDNHSKTLKQLGADIQVAFEKAKAWKGLRDNNGFLALDIQAPTNPEHGIGHDLDQRIVCPNPIVVNSSGIKGVFDIQRVVVKMLQQNELRAKVKNAVSANEKIDGWCTISTGFALTMVAFSCERHVLERQLDLVDVIEKTVIDQNESDTETSNDQSDAASGESGQQTREDPSGDATGVSTDRPPQPKRTLSSIAEPVTSDGPEQRKLGNYGTSSEQKRVSRMIDFVAESNLNAIAGEWVLARFSGSPGAKWFLCRLGLGSGNEFYAHRIATDDFDFAHAVPENGLVEFWQRFLHEKKVTMCKMLDHFLDAQKAGNYADWLKDSLHWRDSSDDEDRAEGNGVPAEKEKSSRGYDGLTTTSKVLKMVGWGIRWAFDEHWAKYLERHLEDDALAKVPVNLHAAIKDLDANKILLPVMFHSGRDIHFF